MFAVLHRAGVNAMCRETLGRITAPIEEPHGVAIATRGLLSHWNRYCFRYTVYAQNPTWQGC